VPDLVLFIAGYSLKNWIKSNEFLLCPFEELIFTEKIVDHVLRPEFSILSHFFSDPTHIESLDYLLKSASFDQVENSFFLNLILENGLFYFLGILKTIMPKE
jgi:hypothetical protein